MSTDYQKQVNSLTGAMGPTDSAFWPQSNSLLTNPWSLNSAPLMYNTNTGLYETASDMSACKYNLAYGSKKRKSKKTKRTRKSKKSRKHVKRTRKSKKSKKTRKSKKSKKTRKSKINRFSKKPPLNMNNVKSRVKANVKKMLESEGERDSWASKQAYDDIISNYDKKFDEKWHICYDPNNEESDDLEYYNNLSEDEVVEALSDCMGNRFV